MTVTPNDSAIDTTAFPGSRKIHLQGSRPDIQVPMREVALSTGGSVVLYDTSGPYTDPIGPHRRPVGPAPDGPGDMAERAR